MKKNILMLLGGVFFSMNAYSNTGAMFLGDIGDERFNPVDDGINWSYTLGNVQPHDAQCYGGYENSYQAVYVSNHNYSPLTGYNPIIIRTLSSKKEKFVVIQKGIFDQAPLLLRPHPVVIPQGEGKVNVNVQITNASLGLDGQQIGIVGENPFEVSTHDNGNGGLTFSPDNMHLSGLPERQLNNDEIYSFVSTVSWQTNDTNKSVDTLHILCGDSAWHYFERKEDNQSLEDFTKCSEMSLTHRNFNYNYTIHDMKIFDFLYLI